MSNSREIFLQKEYLTFIYIYYLLLYLLFILYNLYFVAGKNMMCANQIKILAQIFHVYHALLIHSIIASFNFIRLIYILYIFFYSIW